MALSRDIEALKRCIEVGKLEIAASRQRIELLTTNGVDAIHEMRHTLQADQERRLSVLVALAPDHALEKDEDTEPV